MSSVLVTGASGLVGRHALSALAERGYDVHAVTRAEAPPGPSAVQWHRADLLDPAQGTALVERLRASHLLHLAWCTTPGEYWTSSDNVMWLEATLRLVRSFAAAGGRRAVLAGTCAEYDLDHGFCSEDLTPLRPATLYGTCKHAVQQVTSAVAAGVGVSFAWGRIFFLYGPGEHPARLMPSVIRPLLRGQPAECTHGLQVRDFLHVSDVAKAFVHLVDNSDAKGSFNVGSGEPVRIRALVDRIAALLGRPDLVRFGARAAPPGESPLIVADVRRLESAGWRPAVPLDAGLERTVAWWRDREAGL